MGIWYSTFASIGAQILVAAFVYGQLSQRQKDQTGWLKRHDGDIKENQKQLYDHEGRISHIEGRKGINRDGD